MTRNVRAALSLALAATVVCVCTSVSQAALVGYWQFQSTDPVGVAVDSAGTAQNGAFMGGAAAAVVVDGTRGDVLSLNPGSPGTEGGFIDVPNMGAFTQTTWSTWVNLRSATNASSGYPMFMTSGGGAYEFRFFSGTQQPEIINGGDIARSPSALSLNTWHQITHTSIGTNFTLYVDGVSVMTGTGTPWAGGPVNFGHRVGDGHYLNGMLDEVQIWDQGLSAGKVAALYNPVLGYNANQLDTLFGTYDAMGNTQIGDRQWSYTTGLTGHNQGDSWQVNGIYYLQLDNLGNGLTGLVPAPEPSTGLLLLLGCCALRRIRRARTEIASKGELNT